MKTLPDCPHADCGDGTLSVYHVDVDGRKWCECWCCGKETVIDEDGAIVVEVVRDDG